MMNTKSARPDPIRRNLIAPCGMDCHLCMAYGRRRNPCPGCRGNESGKPKTRISCRIKTCGKLAKGGFSYCFACDTFPCASLTHLDQRYRARYGMSMIENLRQIRGSGIRRFIRNEQVK
jgi:hypothetical protein